MPQISRIVPDRKAFGEVCELAACTQRPPSFVSLLVTACWRPCSCRTCDHSPKVL